VQVDNSEQVVQAVDDAPIITVETETKAAFRPEPVAMDPKFISSPPLFVTVEDGPDYVYLPEAIRELVGDGNIVYLTATDGETWLTYQEDNNTIRKAMISQGGSIILRGNVIKLFIGNINNVKIFFNNQLVVAYSKSGIRSLVFPLAAANDAKMPLFTFNDDGSVTAND
jgi:hypothetical protein